MSKTTSLLDTVAEDGIGTPSGVTTASGRAGDGSITLTTAVSPSAGTRGCTGYERLVTRWLQGLAPRAAGWKAAPRCPRLRHPRPDLRPSSAGRGTSATGSATPPSMH